MSRSVKFQLGCLVISLLLYGLIIGPFCAYMHTKPIEEKLGYIPNIKLIRLMSADHKELAAASLVMKVIMYFGGLLDKQKANVVTAPPDYQAMSRILFGATTLDPYNMDAYYFAQAFLVWDVGQIKVANKLLEHGMKYRNWDWYLPFFAGFNYAYFLKNYTKAAEYYRKAGELSGQELLISLSSRYLQESGQTAPAIAYLKVMINSTRNMSAKRALLVRLNAFEAVREIEIARDRFKARYNHLPSSIEELLKRGYLLVNPVDPYGGKFYLNSDGQVFTTSKFAFKVKK